MEIIFAGKSKEGKVVCGDFVKNYLNPKNLIIYENVIFTDNGLFTEIEEESLAISFDDGESFRTINNLELYSDIVKYSLKYNCTSNFIYTITQQPIKNKSFQIVVSKEFV